MDSQQYQLREVSNKKKRVCVVGAGAAGLCAARHLAANPNEFEFIVFERLLEVGGTWIYNEKTGFDNDGYPVHSSMYRDLRTNLPKEVMNFPDYRKIKGNDESCVSHQAILDYLKDYAEHFYLYRSIRFGTIVELIELLESNDTSAPEQWKVRIKNIESGKIEVLIYDAVMDCHGIFFDPYIPEISGLSSFQGQVMHSHSYRKPETFTGKTVILLGASSSGVDIAFELSKIANKLYLSHNHDRLNIEPMLGIVQVQGIDRFEAGVFLLRDGSNVTGVDTIIFCTGYQYSYPFLSELCGIRVTDNQVTPLYQHMINVEHPSMCLIGVPRLVTPLPLFHMQVQYFLNLLMGRFSLPAKKEMLLKNQLLPTVAGRRHAHSLAEAQWEYYDGLAQEGRFNPLPQFYKLGYDAWRELRQTRLADYKRFILRVESDDRTIHIDQPSELIINT
ncbi:hypothetical protein QAD02_005887 [Eretmocerus hayati]|uniref:Uncharacterized protein n=1 Tax=Eretmocerus hayati TaxID=131215 RepID=A0ACC2MZG2_9HYME|nr:hypothetical protein QAD02_005887 [Eretmocerus hayati]